MPQTLPCYLSFLFLSLLNIKNCVYLICFYSKWHQYKFYILTLFPYDNWVWVQFPLQSYPPASISFSFENNLLVWLLSSKWFSRRIQKGDISVWRIISSQLFRKSSSALLQINKKGDHQYLNPSNNARFNLWFLMIYIQSLSINNFFFFLGCVFGSGPQSFFFSGILLKMFMCQISTGKQKRKYNDVLQIPKKSYFKS